MTGTTSASMSEPPRRPRCGTIHAGAARPVQPLDLGRRHAREGVEPEQIARRREGMDDAGRRLDRDADRPRCACGWRGLGRPRSGGRSRRPPPPRTVSGTAPDAARGSAPGGPPLTGSACPTAGNPVRGGQRPRAQRQRRHGRMQARRCRPATSKRRVIGGHHRLDVDAAFVEIRNAEISEVDVLEDVMRGPASCGRSNATISLRTPRTRVVRDTHDAEVRESHVQARIAALEIQNASVVVDSQACDRESFGRQVGQNASRAGRLILRPKR